MKTVISFVVVEAATNAALSEPFEDYNQAVAYIDEAPFGSYQINKIFVRIG